MVKKGLFFQSGNTMQEHLPLLVKEKTKCFLRGPLVPISSYVSGQRSDADVCLWGELLGIYVLLIKEFKSTWQLLLCDIIVWFKTRAVSYKPAL